MKKIQGFTITGELYRSQRTIVFRAVNDDDNTQVILKTLLNKHPSPVEIAGLQHEYLLTKQVKGAGIVQTYGLQKYGNSRVMVLEDIGGKSLKILQHKPSTSSLVPPTLSPISLNIFFDLALGLAKSVGEIHRHHVIHKDICPPNIVWNRHTGQIRIIDFGISTKLSHEQQDLKSTAMLEGSFPYMSPEQTGRMNREVDYRTDFYSLGITFYELLTGSLPFQAEDIMGWVHCHIAKKPADPCFMNPDIPKPLVQILERLMAKNAEDRYQSSKGLGRDLEEVQSLWQKKKAMDKFIPGRFDISEKFQISQKLYGRENEVASLMEVFEDSASGNTRFVLVAGYSGVGKTSLVNEVHKSIVEKKGYFIKGKFDQFQRNIPYSALSQAFRDLTRQLFGEPKEHLDLWKKKLKKVLGINGGIICDLVPELEQIIDKQPKIEPLNPTEAQNRFQITCHHFISVFAKKSHPLVIFLDDLQWSDIPTLKAVAGLLRSTEKLSLLIIGAYRDNEVHKGHPLMIALDEIQNENAQSNRLLHQLFLKPLETPVVNHLLSDTLHCETEQCSSLSDLMYLKTNGNPFFLNELLKKLYQEKSLRFVHEREKWDWDLEKIRNMAISENVVDLMIKRLEILSQETYKSLQIASCIGNYFDLKTLCLIEEKPSYNVAQSLWQAVQNQLVIPLDDQYRLVQASAIDIDEVGNDRDGSLSVVKDSTWLFEKGIDDVDVGFRFQHDRVQQAAYNLISNDKKAQFHLKIGRLLLENTAEPDLEENLIDIVRHLNESRDLIVDRLEKDRLVKLNFMAGKKAMSSIAYRPALAYFSIAVECLPANSWEENYSQTFKIFKSFSECSYLCGEFNSGENYSNALLNHARTSFEKADIHRMRLIYYTIIGNPDAAIVQGRKGLRLLGMRIPAKVTQMTVLKEAMVAKWYLGKRNISDLIHLPVINDPEKKMILDILMELGPAAYTAGNNNLLSLSAIKLAHYSIRHGNAPASAFGYPFYGFILGFVFNDFKSGFELGKLGLELSRKFDSKNIYCKALVVNAIFIYHFNRHWRTLIPELQKAIEAGIQTGDYRYMSYAAIVLPIWGIQSDIKEAVRQVEKTLSIMSETNYHSFATLAEIIQQFLLNLQGHTTHYNTFDSHGFEEKKFLEKIKDFPLSHTFFYIYKLWLCFLYEDAVGAQKYLGLADKWISALVSANQNADFCLFAFLTTARLMPKMGLKNRIFAWFRLRKELRQMRIWADHCPDNFQHRRYMMEAEMARLSNKHGLAQKRYSQAVNTARESGFLSDEALTNELAGQYYLMNGNEQVAGFYMRSAHTIYTRWGASAKVEQMEKHHGYLMADKKAVEEGDTDQVVSDLSSQSYISSDVLDLNSVIKASQVISGEIIMEKLLKNLMLILIENAGAQKGALILSESDKLVVHARIIAGEDKIVELKPQPLKDSKDLAISIVQFVSRSRESVVLNSAAREGQFVQDDYIRANRPWSVLCLPVIYLGGITGALYMENNRARGAFTPDRVRVLQYLASQAAISLENARLYNQLQESNQKYHSIYANAVEGIFQSSPEGTFISANPTMADILGYESSEDLINNIKDIGKELYVDPEDRKLFRSTIEKQEKIIEFETRFYRKDGSIIWISNNARIVRDLKNRVLYYEGSFLDITKRKQAQQSFEETMERYQLLMEASPDPITVYDPKGMVTYVNPAFINTFGWSFSELLGKQLDFVPVHEKDKTDRAVAQTLAGEKVLIESQRLTKQGILLDILLSAARFNDPEGNLAGIIVASRDITARNRSVKLAQDKHAAEAANEAKTQFLASMSHEIRTPMNAILGMADLLWETPLDREQKKYVKVFKRAGENLLGIINDILDISKIEAGQVEMEMVPFNLKILVKGICEMMTINASEKNLELDYRLHPDVPIALLGDPSRLRQILVNLMGNAIKFTHSGQVTLEVKINGDPAEKKPPDTEDLQFVVKDTGIGIPKKKQAYLFERFTQVDSSTTREYGGTGLGLNICKHLVEMMGGQIKVESIDGKGCKFIFNALFGTDPRAIIEIDESTPPQNLKPKVKSDITLEPLFLSILVVDDGQENRIVVRAYLKKTGYDLTMAENGQIGFEKYKAGSFDLVLMDMRMPIMDGYTTTRMIREWEISKEKKPVPIIALTAHALKEDKQKCLAAGCSDYLSKPVKKKDLLNMINLYKAPKEG
ncbi:MAG: AAA family ATPase [Desulfobacula sp.]|nr:AAA family ATPase [Desulfobacula sp.]